MNDTMIHIAGPFAAYTALFLASRRFTNKHQSPTLYCSLLHTLVCIYMALPVLFAFDVEKFLDNGVWWQWMSGQSIGYFLMDSIFEPDKSWLVHHFFAIAVQAQSLWMGTHRAFGCCFLGYAEVGALLYHFSKVFRSSHLARVIFLICYASSRVAMVYLNIMQWNLVLYTELPLQDSLVVASLSVIECSLISAIMFINLSFLLKQFRNYLRDFHKKATGRGWVYVDLPAELKSSLADLVDSIPVKARTANNGHSVKKKREHKHHITFLRDLTDQHISKCRSYLTLKRESVPQVSLGKVFMTPVSRIKHRKVMCLGFGIKNGSFCKFRNACAQYLGVDVPYGAESSGHVSVAYIRADWLTLQRSANLRAKLVKVLSDVSCNQFKVTEFTFIDEAKQQSTCSINR